VHAPIAHLEGQEPGEGAGDQPQCTVAEAEAEEVLGGKELWWYDIWANKPRQEAPSVTEAKTIRRIMCLRLRGS